MNFLWPFLIIISYIYSILTGNMEKVNNSIFSSVSEVITLSLTLLGNMCLWCGIMNIVKSTNTINIIKKVLKPIIFWLYPSEKENTEVINNISINMASNILGIGNASTPAGLKAMEEMQHNNKNKKELSDSMFMLISLNTTSIQLIPTTVIAIRSSLNSQNPTNIIVPIWLSTIAGTVVAIIVTKIMIKIKKKGDSK